MSKDVRALKQFRSMGSFPPNTDSLVKERLRTINPQITTDSYGCFWIRTDSFAYPRNMLFAPESLRRKILHEGHASQLAGHDKMDRVFYRITTAYWWPTLREDIMDSYNSVRSANERTDRGYLHYCYNLYRYQRARTKGYMLIY
jgi:hypothetical protein